MPEPGLLERLHDAVPLPSPGEPDDVWARGLAARRRRRANMTAAALMAVLLTAASPLVAQRGPDAGPDSHLESGHASIWSGSGHWARIADGAGFPSETLWTGGALYAVEVGVGEARRGSLRFASFDQRTLRWSQLPDAPDMAEINLAWTGSELLLWGFDPSTVGIGTDTFTIAEGHSRAIGALYDPDAARWRQIRPGPDMTFGSGVWAAGEWVVLEDSVRHENRIMAYDPRGDRWRSLSSPVLREDVSATPGGGFATPLPDGTLLVRGGYVPEGRPALLDVARDRWRVASPPPPEVADVASHDWTGDVVLRVQPAWGARPEGRARYDPAADRWLPAQPPPPGFPRASIWVAEAIDHHVVFAEDVRVVQEGETPSTAPRPRVYVAYDGRADRWDTLPEPPDGWLVWTGAELWSVAADGVFRFVPA